jgi:hypothetical protein
MLASIIEENINIVGSLLFARRLLAWKLNLTAIRCNTEARSIRKLPQSEGALIIYKMQSSAVRRCLTIIALKYI